MIGETIKFWGLNLYKAETFIDGYRLHLESNHKQWNLRYVEIAQAYFNSGHDDESFLRNMRDRAIYSDMVDLDNISIMKEHYPNKYRDWLCFQPDAYFYDEKVAYGVAK